MKSALGHAMQLGTTGFLALCLAMLSVTGPSAAQTERGVPYLTVRDRVADDEGFYGKNRSTLKGGRCIIDQLNLDFLSGAAELAPFRVPEEILRVDRVEAMPADAVLETLQTATPVLYVHGYYIGFDKGCRRATAYKENARLQERFLWFTWPSDDALVSYSRDEVNLYWSVPALADVIIDLHDRFGPDRVDLTGHSLGARGLTLALYEIASTRPETRFGHVVLLAADMDFAIFQQMLPRIRPLVRSLTIYTSNGDKALDVSAQLHGYPRLGQAGYPVDSFEGVEVIDASDLPLMSANGHLYHIYNPEIGEDLNQLVNQGRPAAERTGLEQVGHNLWRLMPAP